MHAYHDNFLSFISFFESFKFIIINQSIMTHDAKINSDHEFLHRTQSEDSPKSPKDMSYIRPLSGYMMTTAEVHSRQQSQLEISGDNSFYSKPTMPMHDSYTQDNFMISTRRGSHTLANEPIFIGRNELEQMRIQHGNAINPTYEFETHSLPRRTCIHHKQEEYHSHSLPRREHHHHYLEHSANSNANNVTVEQILEKRRLSSASIHQEIQHSYVNVNTVADTYSLSRRSSSSNQQQVPSLAINMPMQQQQLSQYHHHQALQQVPPNDEMCSTCSSETEESQSQSGEEEDEDENDECEENYDGEQEPVDSQDQEEDEGSGEDSADEEKEIFIDFKPNISATSSQENLTIQSTKKKKKLIKAMSEGEILLDNNEMDKQKLISASDDDLKQQQQQKQLKDYSENLLYNTTPIRDEDIFKALSSSSKDQKANDATTTLDTSSTPLNRYNRETFRKRSVSLEDPLAENEVVKKASKNLKPDGSTPASPGDGRSFASSDDITRGDQSDVGNWNDSQITVLPLPPLPVP